MALTIADMLRQRVVVNPSSQIRSLRWALRVFQFNDEYQPFNVTMP
jgi:hypothetical protein